MRHMRVIGAIAAAVGALAVFILGAPDGDEGTPPRALAVDMGTEAQAALDLAEANEGIADSAPQQQVVNGWVARDLLGIQSQQLDRISAQLETISERPVDGPPDDRTPALLAVGLIVACLALVTTARQPGPVASTASGGSVSGRLERPDPMTSELLRRPGPPRPPPPAGGGRVPGE